MRRETTAAGSAGIAAGSESGKPRRWTTREDKHKNYQDFLPDPGRSPFELTLDHETSALIEDALAEVNPKFRAALVLREIEGLSYEEIGEILENLARHRKIAHPARTGRVQKTLGWPAGAGIVSGVAASRTGKGTVIVMTRDLNEPVSRILRRATRAHAARRAAHVVAGDRVRERQRLLSQQITWRDRLDLCFKNLMRPMALPLAGGVFSTVALFSTCLVPMYPLRGDASTDIPTVLTTAAAVKQTAPLAGSCGEVVVDVIIDEAGRMVDYKIVSGLQRFDHRASAEKLGKQADFHRIHARHAIRPTDGRQVAALLPQ